MGLSNQVHAPTKAQETPTNIFWVYRMMPGKGWQLVIEDSHRNGYFHGSQAQAGIDRLSSKEGGRLWVWMYWETAGTPPESLTTKEVANRYEKGN